MFAERLPDMLSTLTVGLVAALLANQIETSRPVVGPLEPRFRTAGEMRADGTCKVSFNICEPLCVGPWIVLSLGRMREGFGSGGWRGGSVEESKEVPSPSVRRAQFGFGGLAAFNLETGRAIELIPPRPDRHPDRLTLITEHSPAGPGRCAVVVQQVRRSGPETGKVLGTYLWEWTLASNSLKPIADWNGAELLKLILDPRLVETRLVATGSDRRETIELRDKVTGRSTRVELRSPRPLEPSGGGETAPYTENATIIPRADRRSFIVFRSGFGSDEAKKEPRFCLVDLRDTKGWRYLSNADFARRTGAEDSWIFPIVGLSPESGLIAVGVTDSQAGGDHLIFVDAASGRIRQDIPLPKKDESEYRGDWVVSSDGASAAYVAHFHGPDGRPAVLVTIDTSMGRAMQHPIGLKPFHYVGNPFAFDNQGRLLLLEGDMVDRLSWSKAASFEQLFRLNPLLETSDGQLTAAGIRSLGEVESLASLGLSRMEIPAEMLDEVARLPRVRRLEINLANEPVGDLKGLSQCANLRSLSVGGKLGEPSLYRELGRLRDLEELRLHFGGWPIAAGAFDEIRKLTHLTSLRLYGYFANNVRLADFQALKQLQTFEFSFAGVDANNVAALAEFPNLTRLDIELRATGEPLRKLGALANLSDVELHINRNTDFNGIVTALPACQHLKRLKLADNNVLSPGFLQKLGQLGELTELDLPEFGIDNGQEPILGLSQCKHLTHLRLAGYHLKPGDVEEILKLKNLKLFDHSDTWNGAVGLRGLFRMKSLEEFVAYSPQYCRPGLTDEDLAGLEGLSNLKALQLSGNAITDNGLGPIAALHQLERLKLAHTYITDRGLATLKPLSRLAELDLFDTEISDDGLKELAGFRRLTDFDLGMTEITDAGLAHLRRLRGLRRLNLESTAITDAGLCHLAGLESLEELDLSGTAITDAGLMQLWPLKNLRSLSLKRTAVTDAGLGELKNFPRLASLAIGR